MVPARTGARVIWSGGSCRQDNRESGGKDRPSTKKHFPVNFLPGLSSFSSMLNFVLEASALLLSKTKGSVKQLVSMSYIAC
ncbi:hypothetical protein RUM44_012479 [Polyplax serrata]|uniref:Uncharacterized protein n=1 Tax=Polyplax serrata TaxID=468196 RepID=A0ABR1BFN8_POLSC